MISEKQLLELIKECESDRSKSMNGILFTIIGIAIIALGFEVAKEDKE